MQLTAAQLATAEPMQWLKDGERDQGYARFQVSGALGFYEDHWFARPEVGISEYVALTQVQADGAEVAIKREEGAEESGPAVCSRLVLQIVYRDGRARTERLPCQRLVTADGEGQNVSISYAKIFVLRPEIVRFRVVFQDQLVREFVRPEPITIEALALTAAPRRIAVRVRGALTIPTHARLYQEADGQLESMPVYIRTLGEMSIHDGYPCWKLMPDRDRGVEGTYVLEIYDWFRAWRFRYTFRAAASQHSGGGDLVRITLKRAYADGTITVERDRLSLLSRLATSVPPPRFHTSRLECQLARCLADLNRIRNDALLEIDD
jgi:hypothetical protein